VKEGTFGGKNERGVTRWKRSIPLHRNGLIPEETGDVPNPDPSAYEYITLIGGTTLSAGRGKSL